jgi:hypothetical protein
LTLLIVEADAAVSVELTTINRPVAGRYLDTASHSLSVLLVDT